MNFWQKIQSIVRSNKKWIEKISVIGTIECSHFYLFFLFEITKGPCLTFNDLSQPNPRLVVALCRNLEQKSARRSHQPQRNRLRNILAIAIACNLSEKSRRRWARFEAEQIDFPCLSFDSEYICRARISRWSNKIVSALTTEQAEGINIYWISFLDVRERELQSALRWGITAGYFREAREDALDLARNARRDETNEISRRCGFARLVLRVSVTFARLFSRRDGSERGSSGDAESFFAHFSSTPSQLWFAISEACNCEIVSRCYWPDGLTLRCTSKINSSSTELVSLYYSCWFLLKQRTRDRQLGLPMRMTSRSFIWNRSFF